MSNNISFFTAVKYEQENKTFTESILEKVDNYFYLGGKKAHVIQGKTKNGQGKALLDETNSSLLARFGKVLSYFTIILPLAMLITKAILRANHTFRLVDPKKYLEKGINIPEDCISKIQGLVPNILSSKNDDEIEWLSKGNNLVFKLKTNPQLVFKIARDGSSEKTNDRFENMIKAKEVCVANQLGLLVIPQAKKFTVNANEKAYSFIAEESLNVDVSDTSQEDLYHTYSTELNETVRQLAIFVAKTGFNDVAWRNIPVLNEAHGYKGPPRIGLIDVEDMQSVVNGFKGDRNGSRGLIRCATSEEQIDAIVKEASKRGVNITSKEARELKQQRLNELKDNEQLQQMYKQKKITTGKEAIVVDLSSLNLNLTEEAQIEVFAKDENGNVIHENGGVKTEIQTITLGEVTKGVISEINKLIQHSDAASVKGRRYVYLSKSKCPFNEDEMKQPWLRLIIEALVKSGHLFKLDQYDSNGYYIQA